MSLKDLRAIKHTNSSSNHRFGTGEKKEVGDAM